MCEAIEAFLASVQVTSTYGNLQTLAQRLINSRGLAPLDRLAKRQKLGLMCWFCENCLDIIANPQILGPLLFPADTQNNFPVPPVQPIPAERTRVERRKPVPKTETNPEPELVLGRLAEDLFGEEWFGKSN
jgi:hypothetical protein